ncbi:MAG: dihydrolipoamide acetyltransferase family protein [bacterium]
MAVELRMPQLSDTMESGTIVEWFYDEGDEVERGDVLAEVETDKATMDLEAFDEGVLLKKLVDEGEEAPTQSLIAIIGEEGEDTSDLLEEAESEQDEGAETDQETEAAEEPEKEEAPPTEEPEPVATDQEPSETGEPSETQATDTSSTQEPETTQPAKQPSGDGRLRASPVARRMAAKHRIDLQSLEGSGPEGRIVKKDVKDAIESGGPRLIPGQSAGSGQSSPLQEQQKPLSGMRKTIAQRMSQAKREVPHFYLEQDINMEQLVSLVADLKDDGREVSLNDFILLGAARALCEVPRMNSSYQEDHVKLYGQVDLGFAVAVEDGLYTPVIREAETKSIDQIHQESNSYVEKARGGDLKPEEYKGGTFTVSNLGMFDILNFSAVINQPEAGILAVGKVEEKPVAENGNVFARKQMSVTLSCDHRAVDGAIGARYLQAYKSLMENPARLFM